jgi:hypothetical protein
MGVAKTLLLPAVVSWHPVLSNHLSSPISSMQAGRVADSPAAPAAWRTVRFTLLLAPEIEI